MKRFWVNILAAFIPSGNKRRSFRQKHLSSGAQSASDSEARARVEADMNANDIDIPMNRNIKLIIRGKGNRVHICHEIEPIVQISIEISGDDNDVRIGNSHHYVNLCMGRNDGRRIHNSTFELGDGSTSASFVKYTMLEDHTRISIGNGCMFSWGVEFICTDYHTVLNKAGEVINKAQEICIGNRVWIGNSAMILKNTQIPDGCIIGARSVVAKKIDQPQSVIVGNPARVVKQDVEWHKARPDLYPHMTNQE